MEIIAKELVRDEGHPDVFRLFIAVYRNFMEVCFGITSSLILLLLAT